jgi:NADP-dependent 3-hydroxy acid dehydrogenase YdfG
MSDSSNWTTTDLSGRIAVVTGASSGIGAAIARRLTAGGATVALLARRSERIDALAAELGGTAFAVDVADREQVVAVAASVRERLGRPDLVVANAGAMLAAPFELADVAEWERMLDVNLGGLLWTSRAFVDDLLAIAADGGRADLVHIGSIAGELAYPGYGVYNATKAAVARLTANLRVELGPRGVRVRSVQPGLVTTALGSDMRDGEQRSAQEAMLRAIVPLAPEDIAEAVAFSASAPDHVNVAELVVVATQQG